MYYAVQRINESLTHHGILGQKWGKKNGPPYPLRPSDHSASEKKAGYKKNIAGGSGNVSSNKTNTSKVEVKRKTAALKEKDFDRVMNARDSIDRSPEEYKKLNELQNLDLENLSRSKYINTRNRIADEITNIRLESYKKKLKPQTNEEMDFLKDFVRYEVCTLELGIDLPDLKNWNDITRKHLGVELYK